MKLHFFKATHNVEELVVHGLDAAPERLTERVHGHVRPLGPGAGVPPLERDQPQREDGGQERSLE